LISGVLMENPLTTIFRAREAWILVEVLVLSPMQNMLNGWRVPDNGLGSPSHIYMDEHLE
jgi:hypothetical protein